MSEVMYEAVGATATCERCGSSSGHIPAGWVFAHGCDSVPPWTMEPAPVRAEPRPSPTFWDDIVEEAGDEPILAVTIGPVSGYSQGRWNEPGDYDYYADRLAIPVDHRNVPLNPDEAKPYLDYAYDSGFGGDDCNRVYAWTPTRVLFVHEYDGSTSIRSVPRNPSAAGDDTP